VGEIKERDEKSGYWFRHIRGQVIETASKVTGYGGPWNDAKSDYWNKSHGRTKDWSEPPSVPPIPQPPPVPPPPYEPPSIPGAMYGVCCMTSNSLV